MKSSFIKIFMLAHKTIYRLTGGWIGHYALHHRFLLLHTIGRKTGKKHLTPLSYFKDGKNHILVASNWGRSDHPHWYKNLLKEPETLIQVRSKKIPVRVKHPDGQDYVRLWMAVTRLNRHYVRYQARMDRKIPIVVLEPVHREV
jgi:deazaflavin-dependent oxidoreductase (nitroreductase family)